MRYEPAQGETAAAWYGKGDVTPATQGTETRGYAGEAAPPFSFASPFRKAGSPLLPDGEVILSGRYRLGDILGVGGFATVYAAQDSVLRRQVAVKVASSATAGRLSEDEARFQATCQHPNVMPLYDAGQDPLAGVTFLVMPLYPGADLAAILNRFGPMPFRAALLCVD